MRSGCARNTQAAHAPAGSGCAARWCVRTSTTAAHVGCPHGGCATPSHAVRGPLPRHRPRAGRSLCAVGFPRRAIGFGASRRYLPGAAATGRRARRGSAHPDRARPPRPPTARVGSGAHVSPAARGRRPAHRASCGGRRSSTPPRSPGRCIWPRDRRRRSQTRSAAQWRTPRTPPRPGRRRAPNRRPRQRCARASSPVTPR